MSTAGHGDEEGTAAKSRWATQEPRLKRDGCATRCCGDSCDTLRARAVRASVSHQKEGKKGRREEGKKGRKGKKGKEERKKGRKEERKKGRKEKGRKKKGRRKPNTNPTV